MAIGTVPGSPIPLKKSSLNEQVTLYRSIYTHHFFLLLYSNPLMNVTTYGIFSISYKIFYSFCTRYCSVPSSECLQCTPIRRWHHPSLIQIRPFNFHVVYLHNRDATTSFCFFVPCSVISFAHFSVHHFFNQYKSICNLKKYAGLSGNCR